MRPLEQAFWSFTAAVAAFVIVVILATGQCLGAAGEPVTVTTGRCPEPHTWGCAYRETRVIVVEPSLGWKLRRLVLAHERGHFFDWDHPGVRDLTGMGPERFADAYARCRYSGPKWDGWFFGRVHPGVCRVVAWP